MQSYRKAVIGLVCGAFLASFAGAATALAGEPALLDPQPAADALKPGLAVRYYRAMFQDVDELVSHMASHEGRIGDPLPSLDYNVGYEAVLTSGAENGVGASITGLIRLDKPGAYSFLAQTNDGFRLHIGGQQVLEDPDVHKDRYTEIAKLTIVQPGWYALSVLYFERKVTSTLELYWKQPGDEAGRMLLVPADVYAHLEDQ